ncbi:restriction endonuclease subunit S [uncultured Holdemanella sp.]|uniref:restriction endonuclease subunit S n=1 Tax=uncultured Holdemanella sp. TaxID=1763549 RepID=UPI0025D1AF3B|nr:restriction endonuclease subunit S [uncultured Holdemanella sp.]
MVPNLRFNGYTENWQKYRTIELGQMQRGKSKHRPRDDEKLYGGAYPFIQTGDIKKANLYIKEYERTYSNYGLSQSKLWSKGTLCITIAANIAETAILGLNACFPDSVIGWISNEKITNNIFIKYYFDFYKTQLKRLSVGGAQENLNLDKLENVYFHIPTLPEQNDITNLLTKIDELIETQIKIIELKQSLIKDIEDKLLWKSASTYSRHISDFLTELNDKSKIQNQYPLLSSTKKGLFLQTDYFNKEAASSNNIGYKIVHEGDIIISPQNLWMGNITYNDKFVNGLVSPSYRIYKVKEEYNAYYISRILMSYRALSLYKNISEQGASIVRRNLNVDAFNELCFPIPNIKKQDEVSLFLSKLHQELNSEIEILRQLKNQKKYLLCNMFI